MQFNKHLDLQNSHAFLSPSRYSWINYDDEKLESSFLKYLAIQKGTQLHSLASQCIKLGVKLPKTKNTLNLYVNDGIGFRMASEQVLFYSRNAFGTADTISFKDGQLRIHDLKTGDSPVSINQLMVYAALFCLEYEQNPNDIQIELRIYQKAEVLVHVPLPEDILIIMNKIVVFDTKLEQLKKEEQWDR